MIVECENCGTKYNNETIAIHTDCLRGKERTKQIIKMENRREAEWNRTKVSREYRKDLFAKQKMASAATRASFLRARIAKGKS